MPEIDMFAALRPAPPEQADRILCRSRALLQAELRAASAVPAAAGPGRRRRLPVRLTVGAVVAAACAAIALPVALPGSQSGELVTAAWAVSKNHNGTVTVSVRKVFHDQARLQHALRADGIPAYVRSDRGGCTWLPEGGRREILGHNKAVTWDSRSGATAFTIHPALIPKDGSVVFAGALFPHGKIGVLQIPYATSSGQAPVCSRPFLRHELPR